MSFCTVDESISEYKFQTPEEYSGPVNEYKQRDGEGEQLWKQKKHQKFSGSFLQDNLHGTGKYVWIRKIESYLYEGGLYANNFEGYSNLTYTDGKYFEGLLKSNRRFGPGVLTHVDGTQDVGLWDTNNLRRLCCVIMPEWVPRLASSPGAKMKLFKYRKLVPICQREDDLAKKILENMTSNPEILEMSDQLYSNFVRNPNSNLFNKRLYDTKFFGEFDCTIEVATSVAELLSTTNVSAETNVTNTLVDEIVSEIIKNLIENIDILRQLPKEERVNLLEENLEQMRNEYRLESRTNICKGLVDILLDSLDNLLALSSEERKLILNKLEAIKKLPKQTSDGSNFQTRKVRVTDLLAWNNEKILINIMRHMFVNRNMESNIKFNISKLLSGDRSQFNQAGEHEQHCITFLKQCSLGMLESATDLLVGKYLNPDVSDAKGNSGITYAASRDRWNIIKMLSNYGANIDIFNDEGLTPLTICLLRYICVQQDIVNWENAFVTGVLVKADEEKQVREWHPHISLTNINLLSSSSLTKTVVSVVNTDDNAIESSIIDVISSTQNEIDLLGNAFEEIRTLEIDLIFKNFQRSYAITSNKDQAYVFNTKCIIPPQEKKNKKKVGKKPKKGTQEKKSKNGKNKKKLNKTDVVREGDKNEKFVQLNKLKIIFSTIKILLSCGANPNIGQVPVPCLTIAIFTGNIDLLKMLLGHFANPNIPSLDDNMVSLHILAALPFNQNNFEMFKILLQYNANPNIKTNSYHWIDEKDKLIGKRECMDDSGKSPLQMLCMRYDFAKDDDNYLLQMVKLLIDHNANLDEYYLGHTPLSLAVVRGNLKLAKFFLDTNLIDPNKQLGENMGTTLTVLILKRYNNVLSFDVCKNMYDLLLEYNLNPLKEVDENGNAIEFMGKEYGEIKKETKGKNVKKGSTKSRSSGSRKSSKKSKKGKGKFQPVEETKTHLLLCTRRMLQRYLQGKAFKYLLQFLREGVDPKEEIIEILAKFLSMRDCQRIIQLLIHKGLLIPCNFSLNLCLQILQIVYEICPEADGKLKKHGETLLPIDIILALDWEKTIDHNNFNLIEPEIDNDKEIYKVCFYCCKKINKILILCPKCGLVYFCSEDCNKRSNKLKTIHHCGILFYNAEKKKMDDALKNGYEYKVQSKLHDKLDYINDLLKAKYGDSNTKYYQLSSDLDLGAFDGQTGLGTIGADKFGELDFERLKKELDEKQMKDISEGKDLKSRERQPGEHGDSIEHEGTKRKGERKPTDSDKRKKKLGIKGKNLDRSSSKSSPHKTSKMSPGQGKRGHSDRLRRRSASSKGSRRLGKRGSRSRRRTASSKGSGRLGKRGSQSRHRTASSKGSRRLGKRGSRSRRRTASSKRSGRLGKRGSSDGSRRGSTSRKRSKTPDGRTYGFGRGHMAADNDEIFNFPRLSNKYQYFIEKLSEYFPDFDFSMLFLPYAYYCEGQLYYRFLDEKPVYIETYSNV